MRFGPQLRAQRKTSHLTAESLAKLCGISRTFITLMENNQRLPGKKVIPKLAVALNLNTNIVLNWYLEDLREKYS